MKAKKKEKEKMERVGRTRTRKEICRWKLKGRKKNILAFSKYRYRLCVCVFVLRFTVFNTRLSRGFRLGSLVDERIPVPQLLAKVFLWIP